MRLTIQYFAALREALPCDREIVTTPPEVRTLGDLRHWLARRSPDWQALTDRPDLRAARNQQIATADTELANGDEIAFFPPVTGG